MDELVSIIVPIYNSDKYLNKCLSSIRNQSYGNIEIIIIDSGAIDKSRSIADGFTKLDSRFRVINAERSGPADARMAGYDLSMGKYITFVDADDYLENDCIENFVKTAEKNESDLVICGYVKENSRGEVIRRVIPLSYTQNEDEIWAYRICSTWGRLYRRDLWDKYNICFWNEKNAIGEDMPVSFFTNVMGKNISVIPKAEYHYVRHKGSLMVKMSNEGRYLFPYEGLKKAHQQIIRLEPENSIDFYYIGLLKLFSNFEYSIYRNAPAQERKRYKKYIVEFTSAELAHYVKAWRNLRNKLNLPGHIKVAIRLMLFQLQIWKCLDR